MFVHDVPCRACYVLAGMAGPPGGPANRLGGYGGLLRLPAHAMLRQEGQEVRGHGRQQTLRACNVA